MNVIYRRVTHAAFFCVLLSVAGSNARAQTYTFGTASYSAPGLSSISPPQGNPPFLTADFNGDGIPDVAILGSISSGQVLSIFLGRPDASFGPRVDYSVQASGFTVGDFNGDGKADVIVLDATGSIYWGNGDGTLQPPVAPVGELGGNRRTTGHAGRHLHHYRNCDERLPGSNLASDAYCAVGIHPLLLTRVGTN